MLALQEGPNKVNTPKNALTVPFDQAAALRKDSYRDTVSGVVILWQKSVRKMQRTSIAESFIVIMYI